MSSCSLLEITLRDILFAINPSQEDWEVRFQILNELRTLIRSIESLRGATVEPFGSFVSNLFTKWGDLDITIELQNGSHIASLGKKQKQCLLRDVMKVLQQKGGWQKIQFISSARIPILKLVSYYNISCDISVSNLLGQMKSKILFWINEIDGRFRDLVLLVKEWAKACNINDPKSGTLNSYSLSLLIIFHLQTLEPAILPPMKEIYPGNMIDDLRGVRDIAEKHVEDTCGLNINRLKSDKLRLINRSSLGELFISFLKKFAYICSKASKQGISPFTGRVDYIDGNMRWLPKTYALFVEDPFEQPSNTARSVVNIQLIKIERAIQSTLSILVAPHQNQTSLELVLIRPQISHNVMRTCISANTHSVPRTPVSNLNRHGPENHSHQNVQRQSNKMMIDKEQIVAANGSAQTSTSHKKQNWRPRSRHTVGQFGSRGEGVLSLHPSPQ